MQCLLWKNENRSEKSLFMQLGVYLQKKVRTLFLASLKFVQQEWFCSSIEVSHIWDIDFLL